MYITNINHFELKAIARNPHKYYVVGNDDELSIGSLATHEADIVMPQETVLGHLQRTLTSDGGVRYVKRTPEKGDGTILGELV